MDIIWIDGEGHWYWYVPERGIFVGYGSTDVVTLQFNGGGSDVAVDK